MVKREEQEMKSYWKWLGSIAAMMLWCSLALQAQMPQHQQQAQQQQPAAHQHAGAPAQTAPTTQPPQQQPTAMSMPRQGPGLTLTALEEMATANNPTLKQAAAEIRAAEGRKQQAGLYPNPTAGYTGEEIAGGPSRGGQQGF